MRQLVFQILAGGLILFGIYMVVFQRETVMSVLRQGVLAAKGYKPAKTPQECIDRFRDAIKGRDYDAAATVYLSGQYQEQMKKASTAATALGGAIDNLLHQMQVKGYDSDKVKLLLAYMEPFPTEFDYDLKAGDTTATLRFVERKTFDFKGDPTWSAMKIDTSFYRALCGGNMPLAAQVQMKLEGTKDKAWRIDIPIDNSPIRQQVDRLTAKYQTYVKALEKLKYQVNNEPMSKADFENNVKIELETAAKD
jgi:hypothetical protein